MTIPSTINGLPVTKIGESLFSHSHVPVISVAIPNSVTSIAGSPFQGIGLSAITVDTLNSYFSSLDGVLFNKRGTELIQCLGGKAGNYTIPNGVQRIQYGAFASCTRLTSITIPNSVYFIGERVFMGCTRLTSITIPSNVSYIGSVAFSMCSTLTGVFFQGNAPSVGVRVFDEANKVTVYYLPQTTGWGPTFSARPTALVDAESDLLLVRAAGQGTLSPNYSNAVLKIGQSYSMRAAGANGHVFSNWIISANGSDGVTVTTPTLNFIMQRSLTVQASFLDVTRPGITIATPKLWQRWSNGVVTATGTAIDNGMVSNVWYQINGAGWQLAQGGNRWPWSAHAVLSQRTNRFEAYAEDVLGNHSFTSRVSFIYVVTNHLTLLTNGLGAITRNFTGTLLEVGRGGYTVTAVPSSGQLFSNWVGTVTATNNPLKFIMQSNMVLQANFVPNPYPALKGSYAGLFRPPSTETVSGTNAGSIALTLTDRGTFSGSLRLAGGALAFIGRFDPARQATVRVPRLGKSPLWLNLGFDSESITGQVSTVEWAAELLALRRATASSTAFAARYSMLVMGDLGATNVPPGDSPLAVSVVAPSTVTVSGTMADGSAISVATGHSVEGRWPFYASLYAGRGLAIGWMSCATNPEPQDVLWVKPPDSLARYFPAGFRETRDTALQRYRSPALKQPAIAWSLGRLLIGGGNLSEPLEAEVLVTNNLIKRLSGSVSNLSLVITNSNGRFGGSFLHPVTRKTVALRGVLVQGLPWEISGEDVTIGGGWFLGTNQGGYLWLEPKP